MVRAFGRWCVRISVYPVSGHLANITNATGLWANSQSQKHTPTQKHTHSRPRLHTVAVFVEF